jgi:hypothetical protein
MWLGGCISDYNWIGHDWPMAYLGLGVTVLSLRKGESDAITRL